MIRILEVIGKIILLFIFATLFQWLAVSVFLIQSSTGSLFVQTFSLIAASLLMYALFERKRRWPLGLKAKQIWRSFFTGAGIGIVLISIGSLLILVTQAAHITEIRADTAFWRSFIISLLLFLCVGASEEILARGYVQGLIRYRFQTVSAWIFSSIFFAVLHRANPGVWAYPLPMINLFLAGMLFAVYRDVSGSLWGPIGLHFTWNLVQGTIFGFAVSGLEINSLIKIQTTGNTWLSGGSFGVEGSIYATLILLISVIVLIWMKRKRGETEMDPS